MQEIIQQVLTYLRGIWRFRWVAMGISWVVCLVGWVYITQMPNQYIATARVHVDTDSMLRPLLRGLTIQSNITQRISLMTKTLLSQPNLEKIARMADIDIEATGPGQMDRIVRGLKKSIRLQQTRQANLYSISVTHNDPVKARDIAQALLTVFVEDTMGQTRQDSDSAQKFLLEEIKELEQRLIEDENRIKEFKQKNIGKMSSDGGGYFTRLQQAQTRLDQAKLNLVEVSVRRDELKRQLLGEEPTFGLGSYQAKSQTPHELDARIKQMQDQLNDLLLNYTDKHPKVMALQDTIDTLVAKRQKDLDSRPAAIQRQTSVDKNPVYQQIKISLGVAEAEESSLKVRVREYEARVKELKNLVNTVPENEVKLRSLNRDYALTKKNYDTLLARLETAKLSEKAGKSGDDVKFKVIDPPNASNEPTGPNRPILGSAIFVVALGVALAVAFLLSQIRPAIYDQKTLRSVSGFPVFGSVSRYWTPDLLFKKRIEFGVFMTTGLVLMAIFGGVILVFQTGIDQPSEFFENLRSVL